ncbi:MAG: hypothetical protein IJ700_08760 [Bacteroidaceae bacterium]|nr:hypothetical protein [Bacteroidaceae bacterium]MBR1683421.1 hypothetical protein [Bacteroidaceae bacterium]
MSRKEALKLFEDRKVRVAWDDELEKWYFSIVDVCGILTESKDALTARKYWNKLKQRLKEEGNETVTNCHQLKLHAADGKMRLTDVADTEQLFRIMTNVELLLNSLAEASATEISKQENPKGFTRNADVAKRGGQVAKAARNQLETQLGH